MRVKIDLNRCQAYAQCCFLAPDVFALHGEEVQQEFMTGEEIAANTTISLH